MIKTGFESFGLSSDLLRAISMLNFTNPTKVQEEVIPAVLKQKDIIVKSQTGSGKTAAFAIPLCQLSEWDENKPQALVLTPTRELALQVREDIFNLGRFKRLKVAAIYGKSPFYNQEKELRQKTHMVVGTPGRIIDHMERGTLDVSNIKYLVIDEADEMLDMGFIEQIQSIIGGLREHVTMLFSATMPADVRSLCEKYLKNPLYVEVEEEDKTTERIQQERYNTDPAQKPDVLKQILILENPDTCIIFCNTKQQADEVYKELALLKSDCRKIHGGMEQSDRLKVMDEFRKGLFRYLVATDVAARGIDIDNITLVINYDIPEDGESYVHRIGRTGRMGNAGKAVTLMSGGERKFLAAIEHYTGKEILLRNLPDKDIIENKKREFIDKTGRMPEAKELKGARLGKEIMKLHINAGRKTKMRPSDIVGTLCGIEGMTAADIGIINILDVSSFVEILNDKGEMVFRELQTRPVKGRLRKVSKVEE